MANTLEKVAVLQKSLDKAMIEGAVTGFMENNLTGVIYNGGNEVKIPSIEMQGLADYDRQNGFVEGDVTLAYETKKMEQDRGRGFTVDPMDIDESGAVLRMSELATEFQRTQVIPEVDAYRISKIVSEAGKDRYSVYTPAEATILGKIQDDVDAVRDICGSGVRLVVLISMPVLTTMKKSDKIMRRLDHADFVAGEYKTSTRVFDDVPLISVPSGRMYSRITLEKNGEGGYKKADGAQGVNYIVMPMTAPKAISKTDNMRLFDPQTYQKANAWHLDYRKFHDLWVPKNQLKGFRVSLAAKDETLDP